MKKSINVLTIESLVSKISLSRTGRTIHCWRSLLPADDLFRSNVLKRVYSVLECRVFLNSSSDRIVVLSSSTCSLLREAMSIDVKFLRFGIKFKLHPQMRLQAHIGLQRIQEM